MKKLPMILGTGLVGVVAAGVFTYQSAAAVDGDGYAKREEKSNTQVTTVDDDDDNDADDVTRDAAGNDTVTNGTGVTRATKDNTRDNTKDNTRDNTRDNTNDRTQG
ncbi:hypothetical protein [Nocardioides sp. NPDC047086]|uniref:hypothetical protein n=1 Tax=Nocardioides sp. NPDC047086 TaxID=3154810 RepID=UPI0033C00A95